nr:odorant binding protein 38 [Pagiophloeus tsushimanus]
MSKFTLLSVCALAVLSNVYALSDETKTAFQEAIKPLIEECSEAHGISMDEIKAAKEAGTSSGLKPCFLGCVLKKGNILNDKGEYDVDAALKVIKKYISDEEEFSKFAEVGKKCASINDEAVPDGAEGCERAKLLLSCIHQNKDGIL